MTDTRYTVHVKVVVQGPLIDWGAVAVAVEEELLTSQIIAGPRRERFEVIAAEVDTADDGSE